MCTASVHPGFIYKTDSLCLHFGECLIRLCPSFLGPVSPEPVATAHLYLGLTTNGQLTLVTHAWMSFPWRVQVNDAQ